jgi:hypothetical protein
LAATVGFHRETYCQNLAAIAKENVKILYDAFRHWCGEHGMRPGNSPLFGRNLHPLRPEIGTSGRGKRRSYIGVKFSEDSVSVGKLRTMARRRASSIIVSLT